MDIDALMAQVGFDQIELIWPGYLRKKRASISLDLGSIAKGFGVDQIAKLLAANALTDFIVEIGGEVYAAGRRLDQKPWRIGINVPKTDAAFDQVYKVVALQDMALATSGDYRNFFEVNGRRYSHVLDPRTGWPVDNGVISVSVLADTCTFADGLATALMVMGWGPGLDLVNRLDGVECLFVVENANGQWTTYVSSSFETLK
jgi:thiamine biosynthesis lipoprotein